MDFVPPFYFSTLDIVIPFRDIFVKRKMVTFAHFSRFFGVFSVFFTIL